MSAWDTIVVGSGISGLSAAVVLARHGRRVLVLESHVVPGGCMQMFQRRGPQGGKLRFDVGVHYVGSLFPGQVMWRLFRYLGIAVPTRPLAKDGYDHISTPTFDWNVPVGWPALAARLRAMLPAEATAIDAFVARMAGIESGLNWHALNPDAEGAYDRTLWETSLGQYLQSLGASARLRSMLCAQSSLYGVAAGQVPLAIHAAVVGSTMEGPHYIVGGGDAITTALVARLRELGGQVQTRATVASATVQSGRVTGVRLNDGRELAAPEVILALHPRVAAGLMPPDAWRGALRQRLDAAPECVGMVCLYGTVSGDLGEHANRNHYLLRQEDPDCFYRPELQGPADAVVNFPPPAPGAAQQFTAMSSALWQWFEPWAGTRTARRGPQYSQFKAALTARVMAMIEQRMPDLRGRMHVVETATPLTLRDYVGYPGGGLYGLQPSLLSQGRNGVRRRTRYEGLFVTGAGTGAPGVLGACVTGFGVAGTLLGNDGLIHAVRRETEPGAA